MKVFYSILALIIFPLSISLAQTTRNVPSQYSTIQTALNAAQSGDTVLVQPGTYNENIFWPNVNGIKLIASGDTGNTIIDGQGLSSVIYINPNNALIDSNTKIIGFKISNGGNVDFGGGIFIHRASLTIKNVLITENACRRGGAGIYLWEDTAKIINCNISNNKLAFGGIYSDAGGAGIKCLNSNASIINVDIHHNVSESNGGGINISGFGSLLNLKNTNIYSNFSGDGGGICLSGHTFHKNEFSNVVIFNNFSRNGGGVFLINCSDTVSHLRIVNNSAKTGGGVFNYANSSIFKNCEIIQNITTESGSAFYIVDCSPSLISVTIANNFGGGIYIGYGTVSVQNSNIIENGKGLINNINSNITNATNNFWGHSTGPYHSIQNPSGLGDSVNTFVNVTSWFTSPDITAPPTPINGLIVTNRLSNSFTIKWNRSKLGDFAGYKIYYCKDSSTYPRLNSIDVGTDTTYTFSNLLVGTHYYISVTTYDQSGNESWYSNEISATIVPPLLFVASSLSFVNTVKGDSSSIILPVISGSSSALTINSVTNNLSIFQQNISTPITINGNDTLKATIFFIPTTYGLFRDTLIIVSDGGIGKVILTGFSPFPAVVGIPKIINFGSVKKDSTLFKTIALTDSSINALSIDSLYTKTKHFNYFSPINTPLIFPYIINKGDSLKLIVSFKPDTNRAFVDTFYVENNSNQPLMKIPLSGNGTLTSIEEGFSVIPKQYELLQNFPNPLNPSTTIRYGLPVRSRVKLLIFNILGQMVKELVNTELNAGYQSVVWNAQVASGMYFYSIEAIDVTNANNRFVNTKKMLLLK